MSLLIIAGIGLLLLGYFVGHSLGKHDSRELYIDEQNKRVAAEQETGRVEDERDDAYQVIENLRDREARLIDEIASYQRRIFREESGLSV